MSCDLCPGDGYKYHLIIHHADQDRTIAGYKEAMEYKINNKYKLVGDYVTKCTCRTSGDNWQVSPLVDTLGKVITDRDTQLIRVVNKELIQEKALLFAKENPNLKTSTLITGKSGTGKTLFMQYVYNVLLSRRGKSDGMLWAEEIDIFNGFTLKDSEHYFKELIKNDIFFIDDVLQKVNMDNQFSDSETAKNKVTYWAKLLKWFYNNPDKLVIMNTEHDFEDVIKEYHLARRFDEITQNKINKLEREQAELI